MMYRFKFKTLGCKVNQAESDALGAQLEAAGFLPANNSAPTDLYIINTCTVTQKAAMQSRQAIRQAIRTHPDARVMVTGCYAQTAPEEIRQIDGIESILSQADKLRLADIVLNQKGSYDGKCRKKYLKACPLAPSPVVVRNKRSRPFLKIQDGCEAYCTYCIVPYARGPSRSLPPGDVLHSIELLSNYGFSEVVLTGIHLGNYGLDLTPPTDLFSLLTKIREDAAIDRIRLSSIEPGELSEALIEFVAESSSGKGRMCPHFHIPLQSGDDDILRRMNRPYSSDLFRELILKIKSLMPSAAIGADILVGFPGESAEAFDRTCQIIEQLPLSYLHVFPFSPRQGTPAYHFSDKVSDAVIRQRCRAMREIGNKKKSDFYRTFVGRRLEVIFEHGRQTPQGYWKGTSANYIPVLVKRCTGLTWNHAPMVITVDYIDEKLNVYGKDPIPSRSGYTDQSP